MQRVGSAWRLCRPERHARLLRLHNALSPSDPYRLMRRYCTKGGSIAPSPQRCSGKTDHTYHPNRCCRRHHTHVSAQHHYHARHPARSHVLCCMSLVWFPLQVGQRAGTRAASGLRLAGAARPRGPKDCSQLRYCTALRCTAPCRLSGYRCALRLLLKSSTAAYSLSIQLVLLLNAGGAGACVQPCDCGHRADPLRLYHSGRSTPPTVANASAY